MTPRQVRIIRYALLSLSLVMIPTALWLLFRERIRPYLPGEDVEGITRSLERGVPADHPEVEFHDVAAQAGITFRHFHGERSTQLPEDMGSGAAWGDYNNDGNVDLYLVNIAGPLTAGAAELAKSPACNKLYRNNGDGTFTDVTTAAGVGFCGIGMGAAWGDYDNDGFLDLVVTSYGKLVLYRNNGNGTFTDVSRDVGFGKYEGFWTGASWGDYDLDGNLDLYICGYVQYKFRAEDARRASHQYQASVPFTLNPSSYPPERNLLFHNNGDGTFTEVAHAAGVDNPQGRSLSAAWCDFDGDGLPDLYVANDVSDNAMFRNLGHGRFQDISHQAWVADYRGAMGLAIGDWDGDSAPDIFITHWIAQQDALYMNMSRTPAKNKKENPLRFMDVADQVGLGQVTLDYIGWGTSFFDYNNDGRPDLFVANGSTFQDESNPHKLVPMRNLLFWNKGQEGFFEVGAVSGRVFRQPRVGRGAAFADFDNDGDVDIVVVNHGGSPWLLRNDGGNTNYWLRVQARSLGRNRFGVGAVVKVTVNRVTQTIQIGSQSSYLSQNPYEAYFGLGEFDHAERVVVIFPSGKVRERSNVPAEHKVVLVEEMP